MASGDGDDDGDGDGRLDELIIVEKSKNRQMKSDDITEIKLAIRSTLKRAVLTAFHLNTDLWTSKGSHQKFLGVG